MVLGLALSGFVWLPVLLEMQDVHVERLLEGGLRYSNHLVEPAQFLNTSWGFGLSGPGASDEMSFSLGWSHILLLTAAIALSWRRRHAKKLLPVMFAGVVVVYCFIMTPAALWIWNNIRTLQFIEFPWRMLGPVSACVAFVVASLPVPASKFRRGVGLAIALALLIAPNLSHIGPERYYHLSPADWKAEQIGRRGVSATTREEYEPRWVLSRPQYMAEKFRTMSGDARFSAVVTNPASWSAQINSTTDNLIQANLLYFPGWTTTIDGVKAPQKIAPETGNIQVRVPAGDHRLELSLRKTPSRFYGELISLVALLCAGLLLWTGSGLIGLV